MGSERNIGRNGYFDHRLVSGDSHIDCSTCGYTYSQPGSVPIYGSLLFSDSFTGNTP
jgi:hypothetical protein